MDKPTQKNLLWASVVILIAVMSYGVFLTHPIRNFELKVIWIWIALNVFLIPVGMISHSIVREKWVENLWGGGRNNSLKNIDQEIVNNKNIENKSSSDKWISAGYGIEGCLEGIGMFSFEISGIIVIGILAAISAGMFVGVILLGLEIILSKLFEIEPKPFTSPKLIIYAVNSLIVLYATYFIAVFIFLKFPNII